MLRNWRDRNRKVWRVDVVTTDHPSGSVNDDGTMTLIDKVTRTEAKDAARRAICYRNIVITFIRRTD